MFRSFEQKMKKKQKKFACVHFITNVWNQWKIRTGAHVRTVSLRIIWSVKCACLANFQLNFETRWVVTQKDEIYSCAHI